MNRYKVTLSSNTVYKEIELASDMQLVKVGTGVDCDIRLRKELFFGQIELVFSKNGDDWAVSCSDNMYLTVGDIRKLMTKKLAHGDVLEIKYQESDNLVFTMEFLIDFDDGKKKYERAIDISGAASLTIGALANCNIAISGEYIKEDMIILNKNSDGFVVDIQNTTYGVYINGKKAKNKDIIKDGDFLSISDYFFYFKDNKIWTQIRPEMKINSLSCLDASSKGTYPKFNRNTRVKTVVCDEKIEILDPPAKPQKPKNNLFMRLLPSLGMLAAAGVMAFFGGAMIIMSVLSGAMAIFTTIISVKEGNKEYKESSAERIEKYNAYISKKKKEIEENREQEHTELEELFVSQPVEQERFSSFSADLFDRSRDDEDYLCVRLGSGDVPSKREVNYKKQEKLEIEDDLQLIPEQLCAEYKNVHNAPIVCDLKKINAMGVVGAPMYRFELLKNIVIDIAARQYFTDVKMVFVAEKEHKEQIQWLRLLPHVYNDIIGVRNIVCDDDSKNLIFEFLYKELAIREQNKSFAENIIVFFYDEYGFKSHPVSKFVDKAKDLGITFVFFGDTVADIPQGCGYIVSIKDDKNATLINSQNRSETSEFVYINIQTTQAEEIVKLLAPVYTEKISLEGTLTKNISMFELLNILAVDDLDLKKRWASSQVFKSMSAAIGVSKTGIVSLDLHDKAHGPHGLVAGTTGSGKSEILQTYILAMSTLYHPYEVAFVIIDFKGGGMVNQFRDLPHLLGAITNIDGKAINRSLKSIKAELQKRQRLFAEADVNHVDKYIKKYKSGEIYTPLPHLIIIVDEFAELKAEQPEFMKELISAARIGRSLGVHLILATQKPSGQVDEQIWSNSRFKLCLKVQSQEDSNEVLKSPLAAEIKEPGRAYLQVGNNEVFELFQSAYSGAPEKMEDSGVREFKIFALSDSGRRTPVFVQKKKKSAGNNNTQLEAIVSHVEQYCINNSIERLPNICLPPLPSVIDYPTVKCKNGSIIDVGLYDDPDNQVQEAATLDIDNKNTLIIGSSQYGKTNMLQSLIRTIAKSSSPKESIIYVLDFGSMVLKNFEELNHVGGVVTPSEDEKLKNLFKLLFTEINTRKEKLVSVGVSSFASYLEAGYKDMPHIYLFVDNLTALIELYLEDDDSLLTIIREGISVGISTIIANSQTSGIGYKYLSNFANKVCLYCNDSNEYGNLFDHVQLQPDDVPGRCILEMDKRILECQAYLAFNGEKEIERVREMQKFIDEVNSTFKDQKARIISCIPSLLTEESLHTDFLAVTTGYKVPIGLTYSEVAPFYLNLSQLGIMGLCGKENTGHRNFVEYIVKVLEKNRENNPVQMVIFDDISRKFGNLKDSPIVDTYTLDAEKITDIFMEWYLILDKRYNSLLEEGTMGSNADLLLMIVQNNDIAKKINEDMDLLNQFSEMVSRFKGLNVAFIFSNYVNSSVSYDAPEPLRMIKQDQHIIFFEDLDNLKPFDVPYEELKANRKRLETGDAYYIQDNSVTKLKVVKVDTAEQ